MQGHNISKADSIDIYWHTFKLADNPFTFFLHIIKISCDVAFKEENVLLLYMFGLANTICADFKRNPPLWHPISYYLSKW